jgi:hypothetical protein
MSSRDLDQYVRENRETLSDIIKHGDDDFVRALALSAFVEYGGTPEREELKRDIEKMDELSKE